MSGTSPFFSVVTPVYDPPINALQQTIRSVVEQTCEDWELILVDDLSTDPRVREILRDAAAKDRRIRVIERDTNGHIVAASNDGVDAALGEFLALLDHDDLLAPGALAAMQAAIEEQPEADYLYSDEDKVDDSGRHYDFFRKPPWSPERLRSQMYTSHLSVLRTSLVREVGAFHQGFDGAQDHDLVLRVTEHARLIVHVPKTLYHWRVVPGSAAHATDAKPYAWAAGRAAVQAHVDRLGIPAEVHLGAVAGTYRIERFLDPEVRVSIVIPTRGSEGCVWGERRCLVVETVRSLLAYGGHYNVDVVVVYDHDTPAPVLDTLRELAGSRLQLVPYAKPFNFSEKCNLGVVASYGDVVVLLNDDIEITTPGFIVQLVAPLFENGVGVTGARLLYPDDTIQHAGLAFYGRNQVHMFRHASIDDPGPLNALVINRECSGVTGACLAVKRSTYDEVGGMTELLPSSYNDVDFCFKVARAGYRLVWIAHATAYHFEAQTRDATLQDWEHEFIRKRWRAPRRDRYVPSWG